MRAKIVLSWVFWAGETSTPPRCIYTMGMLPVRLHIVEEKINFEQLVTINAYATFQEKSRRTPESRL